MVEGLIESLIVKNDKKIVYLICDGIGGLNGEDGRSELQVANTPNLDRLARESSCGLLDPVMPGITPGSGPGHLALFGYDPVKYNVGRGVLSALGVDFPIRNADVAARVNFATIDREGKITDRRAGRIPDEENIRLCRKLREGIKLRNGVEFFLETEKDYRAVLVLRGEGLGADVSDTDPQREGLRPLELKGTAAPSQKTAAAATEIVTQARQILADEKRGNMILLRGFAKFHAYPTVEERFGLKAAAFADYPFYRGVSRLVGMDVYKVEGGWRSSFDFVKDKAKEYDWLFLHIKESDSRGEDGDFAGKVKALEGIDAFVPRVFELSPDVLVITGDHSTPSMLRAHSWHPVPVILWAKTCRRGGAERFDEENCARGMLGRLPMRYILNLALAHAGRLAKFGA